MLISCHKAAACSSGKSCMKCFASTVQEALPRQAARQWQQMCRRLSPPPWPTPLQQCLGATAPAAAALQAALELVGSEGVLQQSVKKC